MGKEQFNFMIDPALKKEFKETVDQSIGDVYGAVSFAMAQAIRDWIDHNKHA